MKTWEELLECGESDKERGLFCHQAVESLKKSTEYQNAIIGDAYYRKHNVTIENFIKWVYTISGNRKQDIFSANYKLKSNFFRRKVISHINYLLGNGIQFNDDTVKDKLGKNFEHKVSEGFTMAMVEGRAFMFWNNDHLETFGFACTEHHAGFCPIYSEETGVMMGGIRFRCKQVSKKVVHKYTLYEPDGITEFVKIGSEEVKVKGNKKPYAIKRTVNTAEGVIETHNIEYDGRLPIIPIYTSDTYESELVGHREKIDCYDLVESGLANNVDDASEVYWLVTNAGGMNDKDLAQFMQRLRANKIANLDGEAGETLTPHQVQIPTEARKVLLDELKNGLYEDMMLVNTNALSGGQKTATEIQLAYQAQDDYTDGLEFYVYDFIDQLFALLGIDAEATFTRNKAVNMTEETNMIMSASSVLDAEFIIKHLPFLTPEEKEEAIKVYQNEQTAIFHAQEETETEEDEEGEEEV